MQEHSQQDRDISKLFIQLKIYSMTKNMPFS